MLHAMLAQFHEELVMGDIAAGQGLQLEFAIADQDKRLAFHPGLQPWVLAHQQGGQAIQHAHRQEHADHRQ